MLFINGGEKYLSAIYLIIHCGKNEFSVSLNYFYGICVKGREDYENISFIRFAYW